MNYDDDFIIGQIDNNIGGNIEGGDSANWMAHLLYVMPIWMGWTAIKYAYTFEVGPGEWVRHPNPERSRYGWAATPKITISRDQLTGILCLLAKNKMTKQILRLFKEHCDNYMLRSFNTINNGEDPATAKRKTPDFTGPDIWALYVRGISPKGWISHLFLCFCDLHLLGGAISIRCSPSRTDVISHCIKLALANDVRPTFVIKLTNKVHSLKDLSSRLHNYWCTWRDNCEMAGMWTDKLEEFIK